MYVRTIGTSTLIHTPAKVNLSLEVLGKRSDGFHEIETLMVPLGLYDTLELTPTADGSIQLECRWASGLAAAESRSPAHWGDLPAGPQNIVWRAVARLRESAGLLQGAMIRLTKRIPAAAGLGGASSDAAAALIAANRAWQLGWPRERLAQLAGDIGSDVPFFLAGGAAICRGRGERIESVAACRLQLVVVRPPVGLSTPQVYAGCRPADQPVSSGPMQADLAAGKMAAAARRLNNRLQEPAERLTPWIARLRGEFARQGVLGHQMSGSGSSYFGICSHARQARRVAARLRGRQIGLVAAG